MVTALLVILGFCAGLLGALTGIGGGVLITPILALHFGIPIRQAIGTSLVAVITTSTASSSVHLQRHTTDIRLGMTLELATALGAAVMAYLVGYFNRNALEGLFAAFLLYSSITILAKRGRVKPHEDQGCSAVDGTAVDKTVIDETVIPPYEPKRYPLGLAASLVAGALSGLLGIGGGPIKVPVMYIFMNVPLMVATATSNFMIGVTAAASAIVYYRRGDILAQYAAPLAVGVFVGSLLGARLAPRVRTKVVTYLLVGVMFYLAGSLILHLLRGWL
ncbi:MAG: sulfite exporter TauE/SafE family protein [Candidatus Sulfotelmatobacter sp.]